MQPPRRSPGATPIRSTCTPTFRVNGSDSASPPIRPRPSSELGRPWTPHPSSASCRVVLLRLATRCSRKRSERTFVGCRGVVPRSIEHRGQPARSWPLHLVGRLRLPSTSTRHGNARLHAASDPVHVFGQSLGGAGPSTCRRLRTPLAVVDWLVPPSPISISTI